MDKELKFGPKQEYLLEAMAGLAKQLNYDILIIGPDSKNSIELFIMGPKDRVDVMDRRIPKKKKRTRLTS